MKNRMARKVLLIEDEVKIAELIGKYLLLDHYTCIHAASGSNALKLFESESPDLVILDLMLPDCDGMIVCERIHKISAVPIIILTARVDEIDRLLGFSKGIDDYVCKPFIPRELMARIKAILRRTEQKSLENSRLFHGPIMIDAEKFSVKVSGVEINLTLIEFNILRALVSQPEKVFSRQELLAFLHGESSDRDIRTVDSHIKNLRRKIDVLCKGGRYVRSIYGVGYKLV